MRYLVKSNPSTAQKMKKFFMENFIFCAVQDIKISPLSWRLALTNLDKLDNKKGKKNATFKDSKNMQSTLIKATNLTEMFYEFKKLVQAHEAKLICK